MQKLYTIPNNMGTYHPNDVQFLLKNLSDIHLEADTYQREKLVQAGEHYSESLPIEYQPPKNYVELFWNSLKKLKREVALCVGIVSEQIYCLKGDQTVLVSLARAGTPVGILIKRYMKLQFQIDLPHYSISIIRGRGIDENALHYILANHPGATIQFIDGWTGKGAISHELQKSCREFELKYGLKLDPTIAVLADPGFCTSLFGTREDFLIPSACLNSTVSGLVSRTVLNKRYIGKNEFHGAKFYRELLTFDISNQYIDLIEAEFAGIIGEARAVASQRKISNTKSSFIGLKQIEKIQNEFKIDSTDFIKPGVGETTRVLLRRVPWKILMRDPSSPYVQHIHMLAAEREVEIIHYPELTYLCCGLIKSVKEMGT